MTSSNKHRWHRLARLKCFAASIGNNTNVNAPMVAEWNKIQDAIEREEKENSE